MSVMDKTSVVSVGIPTYNRPEGLRRTLSCITGQTYQDLEIIISDNCSPSPEVERVAREFMERDARIRYFRQPTNQGPWFNFQFVLGQATGEYFMWAADDDEWDCQYVDKCIRVFANTQHYDLVFTRYKVVSPLGMMNFGLNHNCYLSSKLKRPVFLLLDETITHKANMLYGVWRKDPLKKLWEKAQFIGLGPEHSGKGLDQAFLLLMLDTMDVYQVQDVLYTKHYPGLIPGSLRQFLCAGRQNLNRAIRHPRIYFAALIRDTGEYMNLVARVYNKPTTISRWGLFGAKAAFYILLRHIF